MAEVRGVVFEGEQSLFAGPIDAGGEDRAVAARKRRGLDDLMEYLHDCVVPVALVTSRPRAQMEAALATARIEGHFDVIVCVAESAFAGYNTSGLEEATTLLGIEPEQALVVVADHGRALAARTASMTPAEVDDLGDVIDGMELGNL